MSKREIGAELFADVATAEQFGLAIQKRLALGWVPTTAEMQAIKASIHSRWGKTPKSSTPEESPAASKPGLVEEPPW